MTRYTFTVPILLAVTIALIGCTAQERAMYAAMNERARIKSMTHEQRWQEASLRHLGVSNEKIKSMTPAQKAQVIEASYAKSVAAGAALDAAVARINAAAKKAITARTAADAALVAGTPDAAALAEAADAAREAADAIATGPDGIAAHPLIISPAASPMLVAKGKAIGQGMMLADTAKAAGEGNLSAQLSMGSFYEDGDITMKYLIQAAMWYHKAAEQGSAEAQHRLGNLYRVGGVGVEPDSVKAVMYYRKAAEQGHAISQNSLGWMYGNGVGIKKDEREAAVWYGKAAAQGHTDAPRHLKNLGWDEIVAEGAVHSARGDEAGAFKVYERAANNGHPKAQTMVGLMYDQGKGVPQDFGKALDWYRKAADLGNETAMFNIGAMYEQGQGVQRNNNAAIEWYSKASLHGSAEGEKRHSEMTSARMMEAVGDMAEEDRRRAACARGGFGVC